MTVKVKKRKIAPTIQPTTTVQSIATPSLINSLPTPASLASSFEAASAAFWSPVYGGGSKLDSDTINYIHRIYCRECRMEEQRRKQQQQQQQCEESTGERTAGVRDGETGQEGGAGEQQTSTGPQQPDSPQMMKVEEQSIQQAMNENKESLKRKLMLRRSVNELVDQGIYPPLKTPPAFAEQRKQLERAKTGDLLRHKLQQRPDREALVQHHILEADTKLDPSLHNAQKKLKKARLQDSLRDRLANRPGPLELVEGNILEDPGQLKDAIREGRLHFTKTREADDPQRRHFIDESEPSPGSTSEGSSQSPLQTDLIEAAKQGTSGLMGIPIAAPDITALVKTAPIGQPNLTSFKLPPGTTHNFTFSAPVANVNSTSPSLNKSSVQNGVNGGKVQRKMKPKPKTTPKSKVIKFHEYKGPPSSKKEKDKDKDSLVLSAPSTPQPPPLPPPLPLAPSPVSTILSIPNLSPTPSELEDLDEDSSYNIMLQQQQVFLQWQLEVQRKTNTPGVAVNSRIPPPPPLPPPPLPKQTAIKLAKLPTVPLQLPTAALPSMVTIASVVPPKINAKAIIATPITKGTLTTNGIVTSPPISTSNTGNSGNSGNQVKPTKLEDLKVAELKAELKKRNMPVSGPKPQLIERLKPFADAILGTVSTSPANSVSTANSDVTYTSPGSVQSLSSPPSVQCSGGIINIQPVTPLSHSEDSMNVIMQSPPMSPSTSGVTDLNTSLSSQMSQPMSPEGQLEALQSPQMITLTSQQAIKGSKLGSSQTIPMMVDPLSRPPSVAPMDVELNSQNNSAVAAAMTLTEQNQTHINRTSQDLQAMMLNRPGTSFAQHQNAQTTVQARSVTPVVQQKDMTLQQAKLLARRRGEEVTVSHLDTKTGLPVNTTLLPSSLSGMVPLTSAAVQQRVSPILASGSTATVTMQVNPGAVLPGNGNHKPASASTMQQIQSVLQQMSQSSQAGQQTVLLATRVANSQPPLTVSATTSTVSPQTTLPSHQTNNPARTPFSNRVTHSTTISNSHIVQSPPHKLTSNVAGIVNSPFRVLTSPVTATHPTQLVTMQAAPKPMQVQKPVQPVQPSVQPPVQPPTPQQTREDNKLALATQMSIDADKPPSSQMCMDDRQSKTDQQMMAITQTPSQGEILRQQQDQIELLRNQLMQSQSQLEEAQNAAKQSQRQLQVHLTQVQAQVMAMRQQQQLQQQLQVSLDNASQLAQGQVHPNGPPKVELKNEPIIEPVSPPSTVSLQDTYSPPSVSTQSTFSPPSLSQQTFSPPPVSNQTAFSPPTISHHTAFSPQTVSQQTTPISQQTTYSPPSVSQQPTFSPPSLSQHMTFSPLSQATFSPPSVSQQAIFSPPSVSHQASFSPSSISLDSVSPQSMTHQTTFSPPAPVPPQMNATSSPAGVQVALQAQMQRQQLQSQVMPVQQQSQPRVQASMAPPAQPQTQSSSGMTTIVLNGQGVDGDIKSNLANLIQALQQQGLSGSHKVAVHINGQQQQLVLTAQQPPQQPTVATTATSALGTKPQLSTIPINGVTSKASSVPSSPLGHAKLQRSSTNPLFSNVPLKEPPKYDEFIKNKQNLLMNNAVDTGSAGDIPSYLTNASSSSQPVGMDRQAMDEVLDILIKCGELPASAAQEPSPGLKSSIAGQKTLTAAAASAGLVKQEKSENTLSTAMSQPMLSTMIFSGSDSTLAGMAMPSLPVSSVSPSTSDVTVTTSIVSPIAVTYAQSAASTGVDTTHSSKNMVKTRDIPPGMTTDPAMSVPSAADLTASLTDQLADIPFMDWSDSDLSENFLDTSLPAEPVNPYTSLSLDTAIKMETQDLTDWAKVSDALSPPTTSTSGYSEATTSSEASLTPLGLQDTDLNAAGCPRSNANMNLDVSDWLDVIMPSSGLTPLSANAPASFSADPLLTPRTQDFLDLFNMDDIDSFEKPMEMALSK